MDSAVLAVLSVLSEPNPSWTTAAVLVAAAAPVVVVDVTLTREGSWAPQGCCSVQAAWQVLTPPQPATHCWPHSIQTWKGMVKLYSVMFGDRPLAQVQSYVKVSWECVR